MTGQVTPNDVGPGYELRIAGHLDDHWSTWFDGMTLIHESDGTTTLRGAVTDQAELHGLLAKVRDLGAILVSVTSTNRLESEAGPGRPTSTPGRNRCP